MTTKQRYWIVELFQIIRPVQDKYRVELVSPETKTEVSIGDIVVLFVTFHISIARVTHIGTPKRVRCSPRPDSDARPAKSRVLVDVEVFHLFDIYPLLDAYPGQEREIYAWMNQFKSSPVVSEVLNYLRQFRHRPTAGWQVPERLAEPLLEAIQKQSLLDPFKA